jgi:DNA-binding NtrC family response regulator
MPSSSSEVALLLFRLSVLWHKLCSAGDAKEVMSMTALAHDGRSRTVLIADDDTIVREYMKHVLQRTGYEVIEASDGQEAVEKFSAHQGEIGLVVLDVLMPRKNGWDAYRQIDKIKPGIRVIFVSGYSRDVFVGRSLGEAVRFMSKPFDLAAFLDQVRDCLDACSARLERRDVGDTGGCHCSREETVYDALPCF